MQNNHKRWSESEINFLIKNYPIKGLLYCSKKLKREKNSVKRKKARLGLRWKGKTHKQWMDNEINFLKLNYPKYGLNYCSLSLNRSKWSIIRKVEILKLKRDQYVSDRYHKENIEKAVSESKSYTEVTRKIGLSNNYGNRQTVKKYIEKYSLDISHFDYGKSNAKGNIKIHKLEELLVKNSPCKYTTYLKKRLFQSGLKNRKCEECGQGEIWMGKKMSLILDHINGINDDNRLINLRILCPNCNATTETFCKGNLELYNKKINKRKIATKKGICVCGKPKTIGAQLCKNCNYKAPKNRKVDRPTYEQLLEDIKQSNFSAVGRKYGVNGNSIRKWIKLYNKNGL